MNEAIEFIRSIQLEGESWKPVKDFESRFWISDFGRLVSHNHRTNKIHLMGLHLDNLGYYATQLRQKPRNRKVRAHQLVAEHFLAPPPESMHRPTVNHKDGIKTNNHASNLEYLSAADNCRHACNTGLHDIKGSKHHHAKLKEHEVLAMRHMRSFGIPHKIIGQIYRVSREQARDIVNRKMWQHI